MITCGKCGSSKFDSLQIPIPEGYGGGTTAVQICTICGEGAGGTPITDRSAQVRELVEEAEEALAAGAPDGHVMGIITRRQFEAGVVYGSLLTARHLATKMTFRGRLKRLRAMWPFNTEEKQQEAEALLLMGDQHHGS